jgi:hypothetical protein
MHDESDVLLYYIRLLLLLKGHQELVAITACVVDANLRLFATAEEL